MQGGFQLLIIILICKYAIQQYVPITSTYDGITIGNPSAYFRLEAFYDLQCDGSQQANAIMNEVFQRIQFDKQNQMQFTYHFLPLPYHFTSFYLSQVAHYLYNQYGTAAAINFTNYVLNQIPLFSNENTQNWTNNQTMIAISEFTAQAFAYTLQLDVWDVYQALQNSTYNRLTRNSFDYICSRGVAGTPTFFANGVMINNASSFDVQDWIQFLKQYITINNTTLTKEKLWVCGDACTQQYYWPCQQDSNCLSQLNAYLQGYLTSNADCYQWSYGIQKLGKTQNISNTLITYGQDCYDYIIYKGYINNKVLLNFLNCQSDCIE